MRKRGWGMRLSPHVYTETRRIYIYYTVCVWSKERGESKKQAHVEQEACTRSCRVTSGGMTGLNEQHCKQRHLLTEEEQQGACRKKSPKCTLDDQNGHVMT